MQETKRIILIEATKFSLLGLIVAFLEFALLSDGFTGVAEFVKMFLTNIIFAVIGIATGIALFSEVFGTLVEKRKLNCFLAAILITFFTLVFAVFSGSLVGYFSEGINEQNGFYDYVLKSELSVLFWGGIPAFVIAMIFGARIDSRLRKLKKIT